MAMGFVGNMFWGISIEKFIYESMQWIVIGGLGFTASEFFGNRGKTKITGPVEHRETYIEYKEEEEIEEEEQIPSGSKWDTNKRTSSIGSKSEIVKIKKRGT
jgi:hypothetical protein